MKKDIMMNGASPPLLNQSLKACNQKIIFFLLIAHFVLAALLHYRLALR